MQTKPPPFMTDRVVGVLTVALNTCLGAASFTAIQAMTGRANLGENSPPPLSEESVQVIRNMSPFTLYGVYFLFIAAGLAVFFGRKWGFGVTILLMAVALFRSSGIGILIAIGLIIYSALRLTNKVGPAPA
ncbi:MAG: hypothetical protein ACO1SV_06235 [Fimbriimonas sp.]